MEKILLNVVPEYSVFFSENFKKELVRKGLHILIAVVPLIASINLIFTVILLGTGTLFYVFAEKARREGINIAIISDLTLIASRDKDKNRFVLGPVTLGIGAMLALLFYPQEISAIAIYALAFGDSIASLAGKAFGNLKIPFCGNKTFAGTIACFSIVLLFTFIKTGNVSLSYLIAAVAAVLEAFPTNDMDNIIMPMGTGLAASIFLNIF
jgi:phytol kinase